MLVSTDIDIDLINRDAVLSELPCVFASEIMSDGSIKRHGSGVYFQDIPTDPSSGLAAFDFKRAADLGYFKVDLLSSTAYEGVRDEAHLERLISMEPDWRLLEDRDFVNRLFHIRAHFGTVQAIKPRSIEDLAVVLALIRPAHRHLIHEPREIIDAEVWKPIEGEKYSFKRAHAIAYATIIVMQMNIAWEGMVAQMEEEAMLAAEAEKMPANQQGFVW